jgi:hypothetical protein
LVDIRHVFGLYSEILPDIITTYAVLGKKHLEPYGYSAEIKNEKLTELINSKVKFLNEYFNEEQ